jgi:hypothetical protein
MATRRIGRLARGVRNTGSGNVNAGAAVDGPGNDAGGAGGPSGGDHDNDTLDPALAFGTGAPDAGGTAPDAGGTGKRRGGWPKGKARASGTRRAGGAAATTKVAVDTLQATLSEIHGMLAAITQCPEIELSDAKSKKLADALANATRHVNLPTLSPERMALAMLFWTAGSIYVPMGIAISKRKKHGGAFQPAQSFENVDAGENIVSMAQAVNPGKPTGSWFMPPAESIN